MLKVMEVKAKSEIELENWYAQVSQLARSGLAGLATDIDGTLSPIVASPADAEVDPTCRAALQQLVDSGRYRVIAVVTGRAALDARRLVNLPELLYIGNHGLETLAPGETEPQPIKAARPYPPLITSVLEAVEYKLCNGTKAWAHKLYFENKGVSASIHYRQCPKPEVARQEIIKEVTDIARPVGLVVSEGKMVVEVRPPIAANKGTALLNLINNYRLNSLVYLGDDLADIEAFRVLREYERESFLPHSAQAPHGTKFKSLTVGVSGFEVPTMLRETADFTIEGVSGVAKLLLRLTEDARKY